MARIPDHKLRRLYSWGGQVTGEEKLKWEKDYERALQNNLQKRKQRRVRDLLTSLNSLSAALFAAISVAERQTVVLQDLHKIFFTSYRTKTKYHERKYSSHRNPCYKRVPRISILSEYPEQAWRNIFDIIDEMVEERKSFVQKIKELVENMDVRRNIV